MHGGAQMAEVKAKRLKVFKQQKFPVYQALFNLNAAFESIAFEIERLDDYEAIPLDALRRYRTQVEELRAAMNHRIAGVLLGREERDWAHYGNLRIAEETRLKG